MNRKTLVIGEDDSYYTKSLTDYIRNSDYHNYFDVKIFSKVENLHRYIELESKVDILLTAQKFVLEETLMEKVDSVFILMEDQTEKHEEFFSIFKYQPLNELLTEIVTLHYAKSNDEKSSLKTQGDTNIISVFSATGGAGKTTFAYNLSREIARNNHEVFYLNLELINSIKLLFNIDDQETDSPLLYYVKRNADDLVSKILDMYSTDADSNINFFNFTPSVEEMRDLTSEELENLIHGLINTRKFQYIIIDLDTFITEKTLATLSYSDHIYWLLNNDIQSFHKTEYLLEELHFLLKDGLFRERVSLVLNRYTGRLHDNLEVYNFPINYYLPYIPEWKEVSSGVQLSINRVFNDSVSKVFETLPKEGRGALGG